MADTDFSNRKRLNRNELAEFLPSARAIKAFENLVQSSEVLPDEIAEAKAIAEAAQATATAAAAAAAAAQADADSAQADADAALADLALFVRGTAVLDFGAFPGSSDASIVVTGQAAIAIDSKIDVQLALAATADHSSDEHLIETLELRAGAVVAGVGFTIYGLNSNQINPPTGPSPRIYGQWNVNWQYR